MKFEKEYIWYEDHYAYHITQTKNIESIKQNGLQLMCGRRSLESNDTRSAIYFSDALYLVEQWIDLLYKTKNKHELELLKFNIKGKKWYVQDETIGDFFLLKPVLPDTIDILSKYDEDDNLYTIDTIMKQKTLRWEKLKK